MARVRAPDFPPSLVWLNSQPLSLKALGGQLVLLDFWTYGCINCLHILPDLEYLEHKYGQALTIIGIHSAKFDHERGVGAVQQAVLKYNIRHPVLVDRDFQVWQSYAIRAYPTLVLIDQNRYIVRQLAGEGHRATFDQLIASLLDGVTPSPVPPPVGPIALTPLAFPSNVLIAEMASGEPYLFIADTGHHRIVVVTLAGEMIQTIGAGSPGLQDGDRATAQFWMPQGLAWDGAQQILYIADTGNHAIRAVDWRSQTVQTIAGTGTQSTCLYPHGGPATEIALNSPWDLALLGEQLLIAMAGAHQIWQLNLKTATVQTYLGTGAEACVDGGSDQAAFAQPSGLALNAAPDVLYVADSEGSSIRAVDLGERPQVRTVCGSGTLYGFGDRDAPGESACLQHCLGVAVTRDCVWIADTYNHKIKRLDPTTGLCETVAGTGVLGYLDGSGEMAQFFEPNGLSTWDQTLYIADTNNHQIRQLDLGTMTVTTLELPSLCAPNLCLPRFE